MKNLWRGLWKHCQSLLNASRPDLVVFVHCLFSCLFCVYGAHQSWTLSEVSLVFLYNFNLNKLQLFEGGYKNLSDSSWNWRLKYLDRKSKLTTSERYWGHIALKSQWASECKQEKKTIILVAQLDPGRLQIRYTLRNWNTFHPELYYE